jgi:hypothetical protein
MPAFIQNQLNRVAAGLATSANVTTSFCAVNLKCDSSQQFEITGVQFGYNFPTDADKTNARSGYCVGYLNANVDAVTLPSLATAVPSQDIGEIFFLDMARLPNEVGNFDDISNPIIISGDRQITFFLSPPSILGGATGSVFFYLLVRGQITQKASQEKPLYGPWEQR